MTFTQYGTSFSSSHGETPRPLVLLIYATCAISIAAGLFERLFPIGWTLHDLLGLSWQGISSLFLWQPITYLFVHHGVGGLSLGFFIELFFHMYLLWIVGSAVHRHVGNRSFLGLYFLCGLVAAATALFLMSSLGVYTRLLGSGPALFGVLAVWAMLFPDLEMMLPFGIRATAKWVWLGLLGITILIDLSQLNWLDLLTYLSGTLTGYLIGVIAWDLRGPFPQTHAIDASLASLGSGARARRERTQEMMYTVYQKAKVFDFETGEAILDDEDFMDAMLTKITKYGEKSLTRQEKKRMKGISAQKANDNKAPLSLQEELRNEPPTRNKTRRKRHASRRFSKRNCPWSHQ